MDRKRNHSQHQRSTSKSKRTQKQSLSPSGKNSKKSNNNNKVPKPNYNQRPKIPKAVQKPKQLSSSNQKQQKENIQNKANISNNNKREFSPINEKFLQNIQHMVDITEKKFGKKFDYDLEQELQNMKTQNGEFIQVPNKTVEPEVIEEQSENLNDTNFSKNNNHDSQNNQKNKKKNLFIIHNNNKQNDIQGENKYSIKSTRNNSSQKIQENFHSERPLSSSNRNRKEKVVSQFDNDAIIESLQKNGGKLPSLGKPYKVPQQYNSVLDREKENILKKHDIVNKSDVISQQQFELRKNQLNQLPSIIEGMNKNVNSCESLMRRKIMPGYKKDIKNKVKEEFSEMDVKSTFFNSKNLAQQPYNKEKMLKPLKKNDFMVSNINSKHKGINQNKNSSKIRCPSAHNISYGNNYKKKDEELKYSYKSEEEEIIKEMEDEHIEQLEKEIEQKIQINRKKNFTENTSNILNVPKIRNNSACPRLSPISSNNNNTNPPSQGSTGSDLYKKHEEGFLKRKQSNKPTDLDYMVMAYDKDFDVLNDLQSKNLNARLDLLNIQKEMVNLNHKKDFGQLKYNIKSQNKLDKKQII